MRPMAARSGEVAERRDSARAEKGRAVGGGGRAGGALRPPGAPGGVCAWEKGFSR